MAWLRRVAVFAAVVVMATTAMIVLDTDPPEARANIVCDIGVGAASPVTALGGAVGLGNPVGDACDAVTDPVLGAAGDAVIGPIKDAAESIGKSAFNQITSWATDGAVWLLGEIVELTEATTSPNLLSKGFVRQYKQMASIAVVLALVMLIFAALEGLGRGDSGMLWRVFLVNVPVAALATSAAYVVVQLLVVTTDGFCEAITQTTGADTRAFFKGAIEGLSKAGGAAGAVAGSSAGGPVQGAATGAAASVEVPLFVGFLAAIVAAFAAFLVWIELLMRSAAIYAVALFMPLSIAASIWPRWTGALKRTCELVVVVVFSKFVIVAIIALAASMLANTEGEIETVLSAGALLLLACFAPVVLFKLVPFAEGAVNSAFSRQSAAGAGSNAIHTASSLQMMRGSARANWAGGSPKGGSAGGSAGKGPGAGAKGSPGGGGAAGGEAAAAGGPAGVAALPVAAGVGAAKGSKAAGKRLASSGTGESIAEGGGSTPAPDAGKAGQRESSASAPVAESPSAAGAAGGSPAPASTRPAPTDAGGGGAPGGEGKTPRPKGDAGAPSKGAASGEAKP